MENAAPAKTVIQSRQNSERKTRLGGKFQKRTYHELLAWLADLLNRPRTFPKEIGQCIGSHRSMHRSMQQACQVAKGFPLVADNQSIHDLYQMSYLRLVKCKLQCKNETG